MASSLYSRALQRAAELVGGRAQLCRMLRVPAAELQNWIDDKSVPPRQVFLRTVDIILSETPAPGNTDPADPPEPRDAAGPETTRSADF